MKKNYLNYVLAICIMAVVGLYFYVSPATNLNNGNESKQKQFWSTKKTKIKSGQDAYMKPDGFIEYYNSISKRLDQTTSDYKGGYRFSELSKSFKNSAQARNANLEAEFISRGPGNVGGRTRAIAIDPADDTHCTWIAGAASGGLWKTTDCGETWENISPDLPNLSTNSIAQAPSNPDVIYVGTGEVFAGNSSFVRGDGIYKSTDRGVSWTQLSSTVSNVDYESVNRIAIDPTNENIVMIATNTGILRSTDGGSSWTKVFDSPNGASVQDLQVDPSDFNIQYAGVNSIGIYKSTDGGLTWTNSSIGISQGARFEIAVAPSDPNIVYTSTWVSVAGENNDLTILYYSSDKGQSWGQVQVQEGFNSNLFLNEQGWYDNSIEVNPYDPYEVFVGGVNIGKYNLDPATQSVESQLISIDEENTGFLSFVNFGATYIGRTINVSDGNLNPSQNPVSVEIRWGADNQQKAHRFTVPSNGGSNGDGGAGISPTEYSYQDYVDVPFEVWDIENNRQLMVSFRDQEDNGIFNLNPRDDENDPSLLTAREYLYIHDVDYDASNPNSDISTTSGGVEFANMYYFWPILATGATWDPSTFNNSILRLNIGDVPVVASEASAVYDAYGNYQGQNSNSLHPDHHNLTFVKTNEENEEFMVVNGNDGGFGFSTDNGVTFVERENGYVTSQFYGADKMPGSDKYVGGMQDNGTYVSSGETVDATNNYNFVIGGDGFEVIWNSADTDFVIGGSQFNGIRRSTNGGQSFSSATNGITDGPFITRLAGSSKSPDVIYAIGGAGVYKSTDFGGSWTMKPIEDERWGGTASASDVEVSLANSDIVWAGAGMAQGALSLFVSTDAGETYEAVNSYSPDPGAYYTGIYTHPTDENTAYALFSLANFPKILKTTDLGQTWEDISGFEGNGGVSDRGFPDVFVHSLLVMPFDTDIIWAGTEIGLYESLDGGLTWNIRNDFPSVSIWSMKIVDDQVVLGTHGRGIWTATIGELALSTLSVESFSYLGYGEAEFNIDLPAIYDQVKLYVNDVEVASVDAPAAGNTTIAISDFFEFKGAEIKIVGFIAGVEYESRQFVTEDIDVTPAILNFESTINGDVYPVTIEMENNEPFDKVEVYFNDELVHTDTQVLSKDAASRVINFDYDQQSNNRIQLRSYIQGEVFITNSNSNIITSTNNSLDSNIKVYPNPTASYVNISSNTMSVDEIKIYNSNGVQVNKIELNSNSKNTQIDLSSLDRGVYLVQIIGQNGKMLTKRIVKE